MQGNIDEEAHFTKPKWTYVLPRIRHCGRHSNLQNAPCPVHSHTSRIRTLIMVAIVVVTSCLIFTATLHTLLYRRVTTENITGNHIQVEQHNLLCKKFPLKNTCMSVKWSRIIRSFQRNSRCPTLQANQLPEKMPQPSEIKEEKTADKHKDGDRISRVDDIVQLSSDDEPIDEKCQRISRVDDIVQFSSDDEPIDEKCQRISRVDDIVQFSSDDEPIDEKCQRISRVDDIVQFSSDDEPIDEKCQRISRVDDIVQFSSDDEPIDEKCQRISRIDDFVQFSPDDEPIDEKCQRISRIDDFVQFSSDDGPIDEKCQRISRIDDFVQFSSDDEPIDEKCQRISRIDDFVHIPKAYRDYVKESNEINKNSLEGIKTLFRKRSKSTSNKNPFFLFSKERLLQCTDPQESEPVDKEKRADTERSELQGWQSYVEDNLQYKDHRPEYTYGYESPEFEEKGVLPDVQTKYVPPRLAFLLDQYSRSRESSFEISDFDSESSTDSKEAKVRVTADDSEMKDTTLPLCGLVAKHSFREPEVALPQELLNGENYMDTMSTVEKVQTHGNNINCLKQEAYGDVLKKKKASKTNAVGALDDEDVIGSTERPESPYTVPSENKTELEKFYSLRKKQTVNMKRYMDNTSNPCEDFYQYACGNWAKKNPIPKDQSTFDTFEILRENLDVALKQLLEEPTECDKPTGIGGDAITKAKQLYQSCMNQEILQMRGSDPLKRLLNELGGWPILDPNWDGSRFDWIYLMARLRLYNNDILISEWIGPDIKNSSEFIIQFDQTTLGLPTRDYYLHTSNKKFLDAYKNFLIEVANLMGAPLMRATAVAEEIIDFETELAKITSSPDEKRNVSHLYQRLTVGELRQMVPQIEWIRYLNIITPKPITSSEPCVMFAIKYMQDLVELLGRTPPSTVSNYLMWRFVRHRVNNLDDRFEHAKQRFYYTLFGQEQSPPRWKNCVTQVNNNMGMAVGAMFVQKYFDENSKNDTVVMTEDIMESFRELLSQTTWIDEETKKLANVKVDAMKLRIGYPDSILDKEKLDERYYHVTIDPRQYFENVLNLLVYLTQKEQNRLGKTVNKSTWNTAPAVVNAYYSRNKNQIMVPAGILQPPFYHRYFPRSLNYGGIGVVIGHEITHGFDDKGRLFDKDGNLHRWWHDKAITRFHERAQCLIDQYSRYVVEEVDVPVDGMSTQGENIADNGGIKEAFRAYQRWVTEHGDAYETLPDFNVNNYQLFFINFAQVWCGETRPEAIINKLKTAVHAPGKFRVIGTLSNSEDFARVFNCDPGAPMNPIEKCEVW